MRVGAEWRVRADTQPEITCYVPPKPKGPAMNTNNANNELQFTDATATPATPDAPLPFAPAPGESPRAFEAFCAYLELGPDRRYSAVARKVGVSLISIKRWAVQFDWRGRVTTQMARNAGHLLQTRESEAIESAARDKSSQDRQRLLAEAILDIAERYFERFEDFDLEHVRFSDACRGVEFASRLLAQARETGAESAPNTALRDQLASLLDQAYRDPEPALPTGNQQPPNPSHTP